MDSGIAVLTEKIKALEIELEAELAKQSAGLRIGLEKGEARFKEEILRRHRELKVGLAGYIFKAPPLVILTAPVIYSLIIPFVLLDLFVVVYQAICFPVYGIEKVRRGDYFVFDRQYLAYLNLVEKLNCAFCTYGNGVIAFVREVSSRTEQHWCPIKHARRLIGAHALYAGFADYGDAEAFRKEQKSEMEKTAGKAGDGA
jgi:hypothetical protein